jgi:hypothetical protein
MEGDREIGARECLEIRQGGRNEGGKEKEDRGRKIRRSKRELRDMGLKGRRGRAISAPSKQKSCYGPA